MFNDAALALLNGLADVLRTKSGSRFDPMWSDEGGPH
jgi:hypothetical protein